MAAIITRDDKILTHKFIGADYCFLPGGRVKMNETAQDAMTRELHEELGINASVSGLPFLVENFFTHEGERFHEICLFFTVDGTGLSLPQQDEIRGDIQFIWRSGHDLSDLNLQPEFLTGALSNVPDMTKHIVNFGKN